MKKPIRFLIALIAVVLVAQMPIASAATLDDLKSKQSEIEKKKKELDSNIKEKSNEIKQNENKQDELLAQITKISEEISSTMEKINVVKQQIATANNEIAKLEEEIEILINKIQQRDALLEDRARALQENGSVSYIDVLLGANSFVDFIDRFSAVNTLIEADRQIIKDQKEDKNKLEEQKLILENTKKELEQDYAELDSLKSSLDSQKQQKDSLMAELEQEQKKLVNEKMSLEDQYLEALGISKEIQQQIIAEQKRQAEAARKLEESRKNSGSNSTGSNSNQSVGKVPAASVAGFIRPAKGRFSSPYGHRTLRGVSRLHAGIDIANSTGTPILAAASGKVAYAGWMNGFGNVVMINHSINGQIYTTLYAHLSSFSVSVGQSVSQGQQIAKMGNTGRSFGSHLHFEVHKGTWRGSKSSQNPLNYINL